MLVDGSQGAVHLDVDVRDLDADFYVFTGHKVYGPTGIGVLYGKKDLAREAAALQRRRRDDRRGDAGRVTYNDPPHRFEAGTPPIVQAIGLGAALDYMTAIGRDAIARARAGARRPTRMSGSARMNSLRIFGTAPRARARSSRSR